MILSRSIDGQLCRFTYVPVGTPHIQGFTRHLSEYKCAHEILRPHVPFDLYSKDLSTDIWSLWTPDLPWAPSSDDHEYATFLRTLTLPQKLAHWYVASTLHASKAIVVYDASKECLPTGWTSAFLRPDRETVFLGCALDIHTREFSDAEREDCAMEVARALRWWTMVTLGIFH